MQECQHVKADGNTCRSPRLKDSRFCYFHTAARDRVRRQRIAAEHKLPLQVPILEDRATVQLAIGDVVNALLADRIDQRRAALVLYGLQTASTNLRDLALAQTTHAYRDYSPELDPAIPALDPQLVPAHEPDPTAPAADAKRLPPKKPVQRVPKQKHWGDELIKILKKADQNRPKEEPPRSSGSTRPEVFPLRPPASV